MFPLNTVTGNDYRSMPRIASIVRRVTSKMFHRILTGSFPKAAVDPLTPECELQCEQSFFRAAGTFDFFWCKQLISVL